MSINTRIFKRLVRIAPSLATLAAVIAIAIGSDHADGDVVFGLDTELIRSGRRDANIVEFFAFRSPADPTKLVLELLLAPLTDDPEGYFFAEDLTVRFHIDNHSRVTFNDDPTREIDDWMMRFGGTVTSPDKINDDIVFKVMFEPTADGKTVPKLVAEGLPNWALNDITVFPRPDYWETPVRRNGVAVVALEVPLALVVNPERSDRPDEQTLLLWATTKVPDVDGESSDHVGMPNTSNKEGNIEINQLRPRHHPEHIKEPLFPPDLYVKPLVGHPAPTLNGLYADVLIYNLAKEPSGFPPARGFVQFDPFNPATVFPNGRPVNESLRSSPFEFPYIAKQ